MSEFYEDLKACQERMKNSVVVFDTGLGQYEETVQDFTGIPVGFDGVLFLSRIEENYAQRKHEPEKAIACEHLRKTLMAAYEKPVLRKVLPQIDFEQEDPEEVQDEQNSPIQTLMELQQDNWKWSLAGALACALMLAFLCLVLKLSFYFCLILCLLVYGAWYLTVQDVLIPAHYARLLEKEKEGLPERLRSFYEGLSIYRPELKSAVKERIRKMQQRFVHEEKETTEDTGNLMDRIPAADDGPEDEHRT